MYKEFKWIKLEEYSLVIFYREVLFRLIGINNFGYKRDLIVYYA